MNGNIEECAREAFEEGADPDIDGIVRMARDFSRRRCFALAAALAAIAALAFVLSNGRGGDYDDIDSALALVLDAEGGEIEDAGGSTADMLMYWQDALYADL